MGLMWGTGLGSIVAGVPSGPSAQCTRCFGMDTSLHAIWHSTFESSKQLVDMMDTGNQEPGLPSRVNSHFQSLFCVLTLCLFL